jgi:hypothetical protein
VIGAGDNAQCGHDRRVALRRPVWRLDRAARRGLALAGLASTAAGTAIIGVTWHEVQLALGVGG